MNSDRNEKLILGVGLAVLAGSLVLPLVLRIASDYSVADMASRVVTLKKHVLTAAASDRTLGEHVGSLVDGLSPDSALAEASRQEGKSIAPPAEAASMPHGKSGGPIADLRVVAEWSQNGRARMRVEEEARMKHWTWESPAQPSDSSAQ
jgi:hypothetical protein